jgi:hypothetical protein
MAIGDTDLTPELIDKMYAPQLAEPICVLR